MAGAFWCMVEDDRKGNPKKVMAEVLGEASRLAGQASSQAEALWLTDKATPEGLTQLGEWGAKRVWLVENGELVATRPVYAGKLLAKMTWAKAPWLATLRPNVFRPADAQAGATAAVEKPAVNFPAASMTLVERREETSTGLPELSEAEIVVSGGRGMKGPENFVILEDLAKVIGAAV